MGQIKTKWHVFYGSRCTVLLCCVCKVHVFLGPVCDYSVAPVARYSSYWHKPVVSVGAMAHSFGTDKRAPGAEYRLLTRVGVTFDSPGLTVTYLTRTVTHQALSMTHLGLRI